MSSPLNVAIVGLGNVGSGVAKLLTEHPDRVLHRAGRPVVLKRAVVRNLHKKRDISLPADVLTTDLQAVLNDPEIAIGVELVGGIHPAKEIVLSLLHAGKDVVTANKALLCEHGDEIFTTARQLGRTVAFEAAVAGGIPIIAAVGQSMAANQILAIEAILNGTSNYILTEMREKGRSYADALKQAQELGYAESDPTLDVNGNDAAQKLVLLSQLAYGTKAELAGFHVSGIDTVDQTDIRSAEELGYTIRLLARAALVQETLELSCRPTLIPKARPLSQINGPFNAILLDGDMVGNVWYSGRGAGQAPTTSAVTADIIDIAIGRAQLTFHRLDLWRGSHAYPLRSPAKVMSRFYLRLNVADKPNVLADVTGVLGRHAISVSRLIQPESQEVTDLEQAPSVPLIIMTHKTTSGQIEAAQADLAKLAVVTGRRVCYAVGD